MDEWWATVPTVGKVAIGLCVTLLTILVINFLVAVVRIPLELYEANCIAKERLEEEKRHNHLMEQQWPPKRSA